MSTHFALRAGVLALAGIFATILFAALAGTAHADNTWYGGYPGNWYQDETYIGPTWNWNAQSGPGSDSCDGDFDLDDSSCIMSPGYYGYGGGGYASSYGNNGLNNNSWDSGINFGNPLLW